MKKTALIVDDSAVARHALSKLLVQHGLVANTASSAEEALEYLKYERPDVVFMDHLMPGMDGFEALEAIKTNPATATIPVMMYTSQEGELYVGQARALGAVGVLPKELKQVEVERVLRALHLTQDSVATPAPDESAPPSSDESRRVEALLQELFRQQRFALRDDIREGYERALVDTQQLAALPEPPPPRGLQIAAVALLAVSIVLGLLHLSMRAELRTLRSLDSEAQAEPVATDRAPSREVPATATAFDPVEALQWAINLAGRYGFAELPLNDERAESLSRLVGYLEQAGFTGIVAVYVHVGRFCMNVAADGTLVPAPDTQLAQDCVQIGWPDFEAQAMGQRQTLVFANTMSRLVAADGRIVIDTVPFGAEQPEVDYPLVTDYLSAGEWNAVAAMNHRVEIRLIEDVREAPFAASDLSR